MREYDIFVPLRYNNGTLIEGSKLLWLQSTLLEQFQGLTYFPQANQGFWKFGEITYRDEIVIYRCDRRRHARRKAVSEDAQGRT